MLKSLVVAAAAAGIAAQTTVLISGAKTPTSFTYDAQGVVYVAEQAGMVRRWRAREVGKDRAPSRTRPPPHLPALSCAAGVVRGELVGDDLPRRARAEHL
jgi:hypothetical protein